MTKKGEQDQQKRVEKSFAKLTKRNGKALTELSKK